MPEPQSGSGPRRRTETGSPEQTREPPADSTRHPRAGDTSRAGDALPVSKETFTEFPFFLGRYRVEKFLGSGAMGAVYLAEDTKLDRKVALKVPKLDGVDADKLLRRMEIEAKSLAKIEHPHVCRVLDFDQQEGVHFIAMEYIPGEELQDILKRIGKKRKPKEAVQIILQLAKGLEAAHSSGIIHRDLKPGNVRRREDGRMVIMDFGLARQTQVSADAERTQGGTILGSAAYMSPEQANGRVDDIDESSDLYALGVMLFELLTGEWPFQGSAMQVIGRKTVLDPPNPLTLAPEIPVPLADICLKMLARSQADRYSRCADVIRDLKSIDWKASVPDIPSILDIKSIDPHPVGDMNVNAAPAPNKAAAMNMLPAMSGEFPGPNVALDVVKEWAGGLSGPAAPTRRRKAGRSSRSNSFQDQVLNWWKTQPLPVKWLGYAGLPAALLALLVVFFFQTEQGVLRIEIDDPTLSVNFDGRTVTFDQAGQPIKVNPTKQHTLEVRQNGVTVDGGSREITVKRGENRLIKVSLLDGRVMIDEGSIAPGSVSEKPQPLTAPFTAAQARAGQEAWAKALGTTVVEKNSIGMNLVLIPPGEFLMGADATEAGYSSGEETPHRVRLTRLYRMGATEVTQAEYQQVMGKNPSTFSREGANQHKLDGRDPGQRPVDAVSWYDAVEFCNGLSKRENLPPCYELKKVQRDKENKIFGAEVSIQKNGGYRLPTEAEWEYACRAGTTTAFHFGDINDGKDANIDGNYPFGTMATGVSLGSTVGVAKYRENAFGLSDMHGNVREWCQDWYEKDFVSRNQEIATDPLNDLPGSVRVLRGGSWNSNGRSTRAAHRLRDAPASITNFSGFRVVKTLNESAVFGSVSVSTPVTTATPMKSPFTAEQAKTGQESWARKLGATVVQKNSIGMDLVLIPPGEFLMGAGATEAGHAALEETPQQVRLTRPFRMGATEVTQAEYQQVVGSNPSGFSTAGANSQLLDGQITARFPVDSVCWYDAVEFCNKLSEREGLPSYYALQNVRRDNENRVSSAEVSFLKNGGYRLPTDAEWEYACRAGTTTPFHFGDSNDGQAANLDGRFPYRTSQEGPYLKRTTNVASYRPNAFGLWDMHGNVREWCGDWYDLTFYSQWALGIAIDPFNSKPGNLCVNRGGSWNSNASSTRSAYRYRDAARTENNSIGFRVARSEDESPAPAAVGSVSWDKSASLPTSAAVTAVSATPDTTQERQIQKLKDDLLNHEWHYVDSLYPPGGKIRFYPNGKFDDRWKWNYWVVGPHTMHVQFWESKYEPSKAVVFTFNDDNTSFSARFGEGKGLHRVTGTRLSLLATTKTPPPAEMPQKTDIPVSVPASIGSRAGEVREFADRKIRYCWCPPGTFLMGSPAADTDADPDEKPQVSVTFPNGFWMAQTEATQGQWQHVMGTSPWIGKHHYKVGPDYPATFVSQEDAVAYCQKLTDLERRAGRLPEGHTYRLPTEAEWEYACRAGTTTKYSFGTDGSQLKNHAWTRQNAYDIVSERYPHHVGRKKPNPWNLYDTYGNVAEWCADGYVDRLKGGINPKSASSSLSVLRGGSYFTPAKDTRSAARARHAIGNGSFRDGIGFRVVLASTATPPPPGEAKAVPIAPPETPAASSPAKFVSIFNGRDLTGWQGATNEFEVQNGVLRCKGTGMGTLYTTKNYDDFIVRLEYRLTPGANNGLAIRFPGGTGNPSHVGMGEIQIFDDINGRSADRKSFTWDPRHAHGSVFGMTAASAPIVQRAIGQWSDLEARVEGSRIVVKINGQQVTNHDASKVTSFMDKTEYVGRNRTSGFFGFCGNKGVVEFRKIEIQELNESD